MNGVKRGEGWWGGWGSTLNNDVNGDSVEMGRREGGERRQRRRQTRSGYNDWYTERCRGSMKYK